MYSMEEITSDGAEDREIGTTEQIEEDEVTDKEVETTKQVKTETFTITAYCPCIECSEGYGTNTSTGKVATEGRTVAVDPKKIPYGTKLEIEGVGVRVAEDCGGGIKGNRIDLYFSDHQSALNFGRQTKQVTILKGGE